MADRIGKYAAVLFVLGGLAVLGMVLLRPTDEQPSAKMALTIDAADPVPMSELAAFLPETDAGVINAGIVAVFVLHTSLCPPCLNEIF